MVLPLRGTHFAESFSTHQACCTALEVHWGNMVQIPTELYAHTLGSSECTCMLTLPLLPVAYPFSSRPCCLLDEKNAHPKGMNFLAAIMLIHLDAMRAFAPLLANPIGHTVATRRDTNKENIIDMEYFRQLSAAEEVRGQLADSRSR